MADPQDAYQRSIDQAAKIYGAASESYNAIRTQMDALEANPTDITAGGSKEAQYAALTKQLAEAQKRFNDAEQAYQSAIQLQDKAKSAAKEVYPAGQTRTRLDTTAGNVLVSVTETADGRGGWSVDPNSVKRVQVAGTQAAGTRIAAPTSDKYIVTLNDDGTLTQKDNPNYQPDKNAAPSAVPTSEFVWNPSTGQVESNPAYRPSAPVVNTEAPQIPDPARPGQFMPNPNYRAPNATVSTTAEYIPDPASPGRFIKNPNYKSPAEQLTPGQQAVDVAAVGTAQPAAEAALKKAQADADTAALALEDAKRKARQAPTDQQAQQAIASNQRALDLANQQLEQVIAQAGNLNPVAVEQAKATLQRTKQSIEQAQLGDLYGRPEQLQQIKSLIAAGEISPSEGDSMAAALNRGTTVFQAQQQAQADRNTARTTTGTNLNQLASNFTSMSNQGLSTLADMNKYAQVGSTAGADAFLGLLDIAQQRLKSYELPPAQETNYLGPMGGGVSPVGAMVNAAQQQIQQPAPVVPQPAPQPQPVGQTGAHQVTINIGGGGAQPAPQPAYQPAPTTYQYTPETSAASTARNTAALVGQAASTVPATEDDIMRAYGATGGAI